MNVLANLDLYFDAARARLNSRATLAALCDHQTIHAMAVVHRRGLGQRFRYAAARVRAIQSGEMQ